jgi:hypothetical protein
MLVSLDDERTEGVAMPWTLHLQPICNPWADEALLTCGRALYVAQAFEGKCQELVRLGELVEAIRASPTANLDDLLLQVPPDQLLMRALKRLRRLLPDAESKTDSVLTPARAARNYIAHECAHFDIHFARVDPIRARMIRLRSEVAKLAAGDNLVSTWLYQVEERTPDTPRRLVEAYPRMIDDWVFAPVLDLVQ